MLDACWIELPADYGALLFYRLEKAAGHKYVKRVPTGNAKRPWRYFYHVAHGHGVAAHEHMVAGASFKHSGGHWHIDSANGDTLHIRHDETGEKKSVSKADLSKMLASEHAADIAEHATKQQAEISDAKAYGSDRQRKRLGLPTKAEEKRAEKEARRPEAKAEVKRVLDEKRKAEEHAKAISHKQSNAEMFAEETRALAAEKRKLDVGIKTERSKPVIHQLDFMRKDRNTELHAPGAIIHDATTKKHYVVLSAKRRRVNPDDAEDMGHYGLQAVDTFKVREASPDEVQSFEDWKSKKAAANSLLEANKYRDTTNPADALLADRNMLVHGPESAPPGAGVRIAVKKPDSFGHYGRNAYIDRANDRIEYRISTSSYDDFRPDLVYQYPYSEELANKIRVMTDEHDKAIKDASDALNLPRPKVAVSDQELADGTKRESQPRTIAKEKTSTTESRTSIGSHGLRATPIGSGRVRITGNTFEHKDALKQHGARWNGGDKAWEMSEAAYKRALTYLGKSFGGWLQLPDDYGALLFFKMEKGASHKYIKRISTGNPKRPWKYYYSVAHGGGVASHEHMVAGSSFKGDGGHWHIKHVDEAGKLHVEHDETGEKKTMSKDELAKHLTEQHAKAMQEHEAKQSQEKEDVKKFGTDKQRKRLGVETKPEEFARTQAEDHAKATAFKAPESLPGLKVSGDQVSGQQARAAHAGSSWDPELRGRQEQIGYVQHMQAFADQLAQHVTPENRAAVEEAFEAYRKGYVERLHSKLAADARTMSTMIAGPSKFPTARNEKRMQTADNRREELLEWSAKQRSKLMDEVRPDPRRPISSDQSDAAAQVQKRLDAKRKLHDIMKRANVIVRSKASDDEKVAKLVEIGAGAERARALLKPDFAGRIGFADYHIKNNSAEMRRLEDRLKQLSSESAKPTQEHKFEGGHIVDDADENRVQIFYDSKPDAATITNLKARGFKWAPSSGAWQRLRNNAARYAAGEVTGAKLE